MSWLNRLGRSLEPFTLPHLARFLAVGQAVALLASVFKLLDVRNILLLPALVQQGEWWRLVSFLFTPPSVGGEISLLFALLGLYLLFLYGSALEQIWGTLRFNGYLLLGYVLTVGVAFLTPYSVASNSFIYLSLFFAFAYLNPDLELYVFFILPVKIKWLALLSTVFLAYDFYLSDLGGRLALLASVGNFVFFFGGDFYRRLTQASRQARPIATRSAPSTSGYRHRCRVCQRTDVSDRDLEFRYCSKCADEACYCLEHLKTHDHIPPVPEEKR